MSMMATGTASKNPTYFREQVVKVTIIEGDNSLDVDQYSRDGYNDRSSYRQNFRRGNFRSQSNHELGKEILVEEILGQGQDHQREMILYVTNINSFGTMKNIAQNKK